MIMNHRPFWINIGVITGIVIGYFYLRLISIKSVPPFVDEFIYVRWAQQGFYDAGFRLISLVDGKQPLFIWLVSLMMNIVPNPLAAGRIISVLAGFGSMVGLGLTATLLFKNTKISLLTMALYALYPFALIHDRLAIYDSLVTFFYIWMINASVVFVRRPSLGLAFLFANLLGAALLTKSTATLFLILIPLSLLIRKKPMNKHECALFFLYGILIVTFGYLYRAIVYLSPDVKNIAEKNLLFVRPISEALSFQGLTSFVPNSTRIISWIISYASLPVLLFAGLAIAVSKIRSASTLFLFLSFIAPCIVIGLMGRLMYPRHIFFLTAPLLILASYGCVAVATMMKQKWQRIAVTGSMLLGLVIMDYRIIGNFSTAPIPEIDTFQFIHGWPSGDGIGTIIKYLQTKAAQTQITIAAEGTYGSLPKTAAELYFFQLPSVHIIDFDETVTSSVPDQIVAAAKMYPLYIIFNKIQNIPPWPIEKIMEIRKGNGTEYIRLYRYEKLIVERNKSSI